MTAEELLDKIMHGEVVTVQGKTVMTGSMWYNRFDKLISEKTNGLILVETLKIAKRASGLENE